MKLAALTSVIFSIFTVVNIAHAQDMWTALAEKTGTFSPHVSNCDSNSVFITVGAGDLGYCIEKDHHTASTWEDAKQTCAVSGTRLPEVAEWKYACSHPPTGLINMLSGSGEWISNSAIGLRMGSYDGIQAASAGYAACNEMEAGFVGREVPNVVNDSLRFRCVR